MDILYDIWMEMESGRVVRKSVTGWQIGRFAVRNASYEAYAKQNGTGEAWAVDHIPSGFVMVWRKTFEEAVVLADDFSRFSTEDPAAEDRVEAARQIGPKVIEYMRSSLQNDSETLGYRTWLQRQGAAA